MKRQRPVVISAVCIFFFTMNLFPTAPLMEKAFELSKEFSNGGVEQLYSAYKASVKPELIRQLVVVTLMFLAVSGLWCMKRWALFLLAGTVAWTTWQLVEAQNFGLISFILPLVALASAFVYYFKPPSTKVHQPEVHYYTAKASSSDDGDERDPSEKSALEELIY